MNSFWGRAVVRQGFLEKVIFKAGGRIMSWKGGQQLTTVCIVACCGFGQNFDPFGKMAHLGVGIIGCRVMKESPQWCELLTETGLLEVSLQLQLNPELRKG